MTEANKQAMDFVYIGRTCNFDGSNSCVRIQLINEDGTLGRIMAYKYKQKLDRSVGAIYKGASFDLEGGTAYGLETAQWKGRWNDAEARIEWQAAHEKAEAILRTKAMEADSGKIGDLERMLSDARALYEKYRQRYDRAGMDALEQSVLRALRTPPRKLEANHVADWRAEK